MKIRVSFFAALFILIGCSSHKLDNMYYSSAAKLLHSDPTKAMAILENIDIMTISNKKDYAHYAVLYTFAADKLSIRHTSDSLINCAVKYYQKRGDNKDKATAYYLQGRVLSQLGQSDEAANSYLKAVKFVDLTDDNYLKGLIYSHIAERFQRNNEFEAAYDSLEKSILFFNQAGEQVNEGLVLNLLARNYFFIGKYDEALLAYNKALKLFEGCGRDDLALTISSAIASLCLQQLEDPQKALDELLLAYKKYNNNVTPVSDYHLLSYIFFFLGQENKAIEIANEYMDLDITPEEKANTLYLLSEYEATLGNFGKAYNYLNEYMVLRDVVNELETETLLSELKNQFEKQELTTSYQNLKRRTKSQIIIGLLAFSLFISFSIGIIRRYILRHRIAIKEREELEGTIDRLASSATELSELQGKVKNILNENNEREEHLKALLNKRILNFQEILEISSMHDNNPVLFQETIKRRIIDAERDHYFGELHEIVNYKHNGIVKYLKDKHIDLNEEEINLCCMICLGFSNNQMSILFGHSNPNSIFMKRHKIRKKLGLATGSGSLEQHIQDITVSLTKDRTTGEI